MSNSIAGLVSKIDGSSRVEFPKEVKASEKTKSILSRMLVKDQEQRIGWMQLFDEFGLGGK